MIFDNILYYSAHDIFMDEYFELALESAENASNGIEIRERKLTSSLSSLSFRTAGTNGRTGVCHTLITTGNVLEDRTRDEIERAVSSLLSRSIGKRMRRVLAVGLGNPAAVVDSLGCETVKRLRSGERGKGYLATMIPSVYGLTGLESASIVRGVAAEYRPDLVIAADTLATRRAERLFRAVQIGENVVPGGGVGNRRTPLSFETIGVPVLSLGVPLLAHAERCSSLPDSLVVTPKEIDLLVPAFAEILAEGIERVLSENIG